MIYCGKCGKVNPDGTKFCGGCGAKIEEVQNPVVQTEEVEKPENTEAKCWSVFAKIGFILGIITIACASSFVLSSLALGIGEPALVFSILGRKSKKPGSHTKAKVGMILSIVGLVVGFILYIIFMATIAKGSVDGIIEGSF